MPRTAGTDHKLSLACSRAALPHCHTAALPHRCDWHKVQFLVKSEAALCAAHRMPPAVPCLRTSVSTSPSVSAIPSASASASTCNIYNCGLPAHQPPTPWPLTSLRETSPRFCVGGNVVFAMQIQLVPPFAFGKCLLLRCLFVSAGAKSGVNYAFDCCPLPLLLLLRSCSAAFPLQLRADFAASKVSCATYAGGQRIENLFLDNNNNTRN